ncbi:beta-propeller domain-containing protein [bacterium]|nr:beta-propeller domain-containing protein [bacterium]
MTPSPTRSSSKKYRAGLYAVMFALIAAVNFAWPAPAAAQEYDPTLEYVSSCAEAEAWLKAATIAAMEERIDRDNPWEDPWSGGWDDDWDDDWGDDDDWDDDGDDDDFQIGENERDDDDQSGRPLDDDGATGGDDDDDGACGGCGCGFTGDDSAENDGDDDSAAGSDDDAANNDDTDDDDDDGLDDDDSHSDDDTNGGGDDDMADDDMDDDDDDDDGGDDDAYSETNNQEKGVDEDDIIKTDGEYLYALVGGVLYILDAQPAWATRVIGSVEVENWGAGMHLFGDRVVVISGVEYRPSSEDVFPGVPNAQITGAVTKITIIDVSDRTAPAVTGEHFIEADIAGSRRIGERIYFAMRTTKGGPAVEYNIFVNYPTEDEHLKALEELKKQNREIINAGTLDQWLPRSYIRLAAAESEVEFLVPCDELFHPAQPEGGDVLSILTYDFASATANTHALGVLASGLSPYATTERLYVAGTMIGVRRDLGLLPAFYPEASGVHRFDIAPETGVVSYAASAPVPGFVLNPFSMGEYDGYLRVASTYPTGVEGAVASGVYVYDASDGALTPTGFVEDIAPGEELYTARFMGDRGYLVTYPIPFSELVDGGWVGENPWATEEDEGDGEGSCDPLFTLDLADPYDPKVLGELIIPGFSTYLHPLGDDHLMAIGEGGDEFGANGGVALSMFDVSDMADPRRVHFLDLGAAGVTSQAKLEHHAFFYYEPYDLLSIPLVDTQWIGDGGSPGLFAGFLAFDVSVEDGFDFIGEIEHTRIGGWFGGLAIPLRSAVIDNALYTLSTNGVKVTNLDSWIDIAKVRLR